MALQTHHLACARGGALLFDDLDLKIRPGEALKVSGPNGAGKSTLLRMLCGLTEPTRGHVMWQGLPIRSWREPLHRALLYMGHGSGLKDELTALENLLMATRLSGRTCMDLQAFKALDTLGLATVAHEPAGRLSQGQRRRINLARLALAPQPKLIILDEPYNALDQATVAQLTGLLHKHLFEGAVLVYTTHQDLPLEGLLHHEVSLGRALPAKVLSSQSAPAWVLRPMGVA